MKAEFSAKSQRVTSNNRRITAWDRSRRLEIQKSPLRFSERAAKSEHEASLKLRSIQWETRSCPRFDPENPRRSFSPPRNYSGIGGRVHVRRRMHARTRVRVPDTDPSSRVGERWLRGGLGSRACVRERDRQVCEGATLSRQGAPRVCVPARRADYPHPRAVVP